MHFKPKKRLGQVFLTDKNIQKKIIDCLELKSSDIILEIGAGRGEITGLIAKRVRKVYALEIDARLTEILKDNLRGSLNTEIINRDILRFSLARYFSRLNNRIKVVGNIPYYLSSPIIEHLFNFRNKINTVFITVQKEFAKRITAAPGSKDYGSFSCFVKYYANPKIIFNIKKNSFWPVPKVDSCFLRLDIRRRPALSKKNERLFFKITRAAFNKRRKTLRNSLFGIIPAKKLSSFFSKNRIDANCRPEKLTLEDFARLAKI